MDQLAANGIYAILATPSGARPAWLSQKYPEVLRVEATGSEFYMETGIIIVTLPQSTGKKEIINTKLAERYKEHPLTGVACVQ